MFVYKLDPERILSIPSYLLNILVEYLPALESNALMDIISAFIVPDMESETRDEYINALKESMELLAPVDTGIKQEYEFAEKDPKKAAEYFALLGIKTE